MQRALERRGEKAALAGGSNTRPVSTFRIAFANIQFPATPEESVMLAEQAIARASVERADIICFPECFIPGYRGMGKPVPPPDPVFLERAWSVIAAAAARSSSTPPRRVPIRPAQGGGFPEQAR